MMAFHTTRRNRRRRTQAATTALALLAPSLCAAHMFPYIPTDILMPDYSCSSSDISCVGDDTAYIFRQSDRGDVEFRSFNFSSGVNAQVHLETPSEELPFLHGKPSTTAFDAARAANGTLLVYAGDCTGDSGNVWSFDPTGSAWTQRKLSSDKSTARAPYFMGGTVAFSSVLAPNMDEPSLYTYGGMCGTPKSTGSDWQSAANYTKSMISLTPSQMDKDKTPYSLAIASNAGPRTPIAGFTLTGLTPSMTNKSGIVTQQVSYVLLGGHSQTAFINMSTAAVWNLPAESWSYVSINAPRTGLKNTDLARQFSQSNSKQRRSTTIDNVYSRSGHTATLNEDGTAIIIYGGWVGDVSTPAEPQLAILEMSETYSDWQWKIPSKQPEFSYYGHGAALLPGNVLMVYGGWEIGSSSSKVKRQSTATARFFNMTTMDWVSSYKNPNAGELSNPENAPQENKHGPSAKTLGLGLGLGFGLAIIAAAFLAFFCWRRKRKHRDQAVRALSQDASHFLADHDEMMERDDPWGLAGWRGQDPLGGERSLGYESLRTDRSGAGGLPGLHIPRKPMTRQSPRGYVAAAGPRPGSFGAGQGGQHMPGEIHPIYEDEEEESMHRRSTHERHPSDGLEDPFQTPTTAVPPPLFSGNRNTTPSPEGQPRHDPEVQDWVSDVDAADALLARMGSRHGRTSPSRRNSHRSTAQRDDESRHGSNLSESARSMTESLKQNAGRRLTILGPALWGGNTDHPKPGSSSSSSYNTARSSFGALQAEGPELLMGRGGGGGGGGGGYEDDEPQLPPSPSKTKPRRGFFGSLRRVFSGSSTPTSSREDMSQVRRSFDQEPVGGDYEPGLVGLRGELLRRKQGRQAWEEAGNSAAAGEGPIQATKAMATGGLGTNMLGNESDWDIERAVEQRLVQVMFTVPRERLRVVNGDEDAGEDDETHPQPQAAVLVDPDQVSSLSSNQGSIREKAAEADLRPQSLDEDEKLDEKLEELLDEKFEEKQHLYDEMDARRRLYGERAGEKETLMPSIEEPESPQETGQRDHLQAIPIPPLFHHQHCRNKSADYEIVDEVPLGGSSRNSASLSFLHHPELAPRTPRHSHVSDVSTERPLSGIVMEAQAMPLTRERAKTRVLAMVDSYESLSREGSPSRDK